jgi:hypothetical protein
VNCVGEATLAQYAAAVRDPMDSPQSASQFWREVVAVDPCQEADKEQLVAVLLNDKLRWQNAPNSGQTGRIFSDNPGHEPENVNRLRGNRCLPNH